MKSFIALAVLFTTALAIQQNPHDARMHRRSLQARATMLERRMPAPQGGGIQLPPIVGGDDDSTTTDSTTTTTTTSRTSDTTTSTTTTRQPDPPTTTTTTTSETTTSTTSTSTTSTSTTSTSTTSISTIPSITGIPRTTQDTYTGISYATQRTTTLRGSITSDASEPTDTSTPAPSFLQNKAAVAATATVAAIVAVGALVFLAFWWKKKADRGKMGEEDMWDEASMKEFSRRPVSPGPIVPPPVARRNVDLDSEMGAYSAGPLARSNTKVLPSQSAGSSPLSRSRSQHAAQQDMYEEPDELLAMPPVAHYERPRDSAYDIVPAAPPMAAYGQQHSQGYGYSNAVASGSGGGGLAPPARKGDHTSFGSGLGNDPFAGSGFVDANRESTYGPGQAGRGAGGAAPGMGGHDAGVVPNQWPQGYNPYTGYSQGSQAPYGGGYGYAS